MMMNIWQHMKTQRHSYKKVCYRLLHSAPRVKRASFLLAVDGIDVFWPKFYGNGVFPCQNIDTVR